MLSYGSYCFNQLINFTSALVGPNYTTSALMYLGLITPEIQSASTGGNKLSNVNLMYLELITPGYITII